MVLKRDTPKWVEVVIPRDNEALKTLTSSYYVFNAFQIVPQSYKRLGMVEPTETSVQSWMVVCKRTDMQMRSTSPYQKPIKPSSHLHRLVIVYLMRFSLCHEAKNVLHVRSTWNAQSSVSKRCNYWQADEFEFFVPKANRALQSLLPTCYYLFNPI